MSFTLDQHVQTWLPAILELHYKSRSHEHSALKNHPEFSLDLDRTCVAFIEENSTQKVSKLLARYCDSLMRNFPTKSNRKGLDDSLTNLVNFIIFL